MSFNFQKFITELTNTVSDDIDPNRSKKTFFTETEELSISAKSKITAKKVSETAYNILKQYKNNVGVIIKYIESKGTKIVRCPKLLPIIKFIGYDEGFIPKHYGLKAFLLNIAVSISTKDKLKLSACFEDTLIICQKEISLYFLAYNLHHWLAYKNKLAGYEQKTFRIFKNAMNTNINVKGLTMNQLIAIKDAIEREKQAIDFVTDFVREQIGAKECVKSILNGEKVKI